MKQVYEDPNLRILYFDCRDIVICSLNDEVIDDNLSSSGNFGDIVRP